MAENDVYRYRPAVHNCLEGIAIENEHGVLYDTYWGIDDAGAECVGRDAQDLTLIGNLGDYERIDRNAEHPFDDYAPVDRLAITSQHGLQRALFVRKGADPDHATKVRNARNELEDATHAVEAAQRRAERARQALADLEAGTHA